MPASLDRMMVAADVIDLYGDERVKTFTVRCSGSVRLYGPEIDIIDTDAFQRLDGMRQLGAAYLVFRSANHTRFEHSLGTLHQAQRIIEAVNGNPRARRRIDPTGQRLARLFALLHDLTHVPYGHTLEDEFQLLRRHDENAERQQRLLWGGPIGKLLEEALASRKVQDGRSELELLAALLQRGEEAAEELGPYAYVVDLVTNTVCADALDYVPRDLTGCGMPVAIGDHFLDYFDIVPLDHRDPNHRSRMALRLDKRGMPRPDVESEIHKLLEHRYELVERVFFHHAKNAASAMIARAVQESGLAEHEEIFDLLSDELLCLALISPQVARALGFPSSKSGDPQLATRLADEVRRRRLYKLAYLGVPDDDVARRAKLIFETHCSSAAQRATAEDELAELSGLERGQVLIHIPSPRMLAKEGYVRVMLDDGDTIFLREWDTERSRRLESLSRAHERLWRVAVYAHPEAGEEELRLLSNAAGQRFALRCRYVKEPHADPYLGELFDQYAELRDWPAHLRSGAIAIAGRAAAQAHTQGRSASRTKDAMLDLLSAAVAELQARKHESPDQTRLFDQ